VPPRSTSTSENASAHADDSSAGAALAEDAPADDTPGDAGPDPRGLGEGDDHAPDGGEVGVRPRPLSGVANARAHDAAWFEALVREHATAVHRFLVRRAGRGEADDLAADVLTTAWRRRDDIPDGAELPWLYRTAGFVVANHRRKGRPVPVGDVPDDVLGSGDPAALFIQDEQVRTVLGALGVRDRQILLLNAWEGLVGDGLAAVLGVSRGGADAALSRARSRLREAWAAAG
jgi:DNA-directed RNA polymerase specialized sigma24 family protein